MMAPPIDAEMMSRADAERVDKRIRLLVGTVNDNLDKLHSLVEEARTGRAWEALGYKSWTTYLIDVFPANVKLDRGQRRELVDYLTGEGMSNRAAADALGVDEGTVRNDRRATAENSAVDDEKKVGKDGKARRKPKRKAEAKQDDSNGHPKLHPCEQVGLLGGMLAYLDDGDFTEVRATTRTALVEILRAELSAQPVSVIKEARANVEADLWPTLEWNPGNWDDYKINQNRRLARLAKGMHDNLDGVDELGNEGVMLARVGQSIADFVHAENKVLGLAQTMQAVSEFAASYRMSSK